MIKTALVFAAGRGERLRPLTDVQPKPMCRVKDIPLMEHLVNHLTQQGIEHIVVNHAYLGSQIRHHFKKGQAFGVEISYSPEPPGALETGGAIIQALPLLGKDPFITVSSDIYTDYPFASLHLRQDAPIHLVLVPNPPYIQEVDFGLVEHQVTLTQKRFTFGNIACFHPSVFESLSPSRLRLGSILRTYVEKQQVTGEAYQGMWMNIGSIEILKQANEFER